MQKKNVLTMALSVSLVGVIAVGGTLAYLTANTGVVTNTFTTSANIQMNLTEKYYKEGVLQADRTSTGSQYKDVLPDVDYEKDPAVQMTSVPTGGAYVFMAVTGLDKSMDVDKYTVNTTIGTGWEKITEDTVEDGLDGLYVYVGDDDYADKWVNKQSGDNRMTALFSKVKFDFSSDFYNDPVGSIGDIKVVAYAAQAQGTDFVTVANDALTTLTGKDALNTSFTIDADAVAAATPVVTAD